MTPINTNKPEFPGKLRGIPTTLFSLALILGSLSMVFSEAPVFAGITVFVLGLFIFTFARRIVTIVGIIAPCLILIATTGNLTLPSIYIGFIYSFGVSAYLKIGKGSFTVIAPVLSAYIAAAIVLGPINALPVFIPAALGFLATPLLKRRPLSETLSLLTILILGSALIAFILLGGNLSETAEYLRTYITDLYANVNEEILIIEESFVEMLAAYFVNILPGLLFAAASAICYISCALTNALFASSSEAEIPENMRVLRLSPVSGVIYIASFLLSTAFSIEGGSYEMAGAVTDNILVALSLPFIVMGCSSVVNFFKRRSARNGSRLLRVPYLSLAILLMVSTSIAVTLIICIGVSSSIKPMTSAIFNKFTRPNEKK